MENIFRWNHSFDQRSIIKRFIIVSSLILSILLGRLVAQEISLNIRLPPLEILLVLIHLILALFPFTNAFMSGEFELFEPIYVFALYTMIAFVWTPMGMIVKGDYSLQSVSFHPQFIPSMLIAALAQISLYIGYYIQLGGSVARHFQKLPKVDRTLAFKWSIGVSLCVLALLALWIETTGLSLRNFNALATGQDYGTWWREAELRVNFLGAARESLVAVMLLLIAFRPQRKVGIYFLGWTLIFLFLAQFGGRSRVLTYIIATGIYLYLEKGARPNLIQLLFAGFLVFYLIGALGYYRHPNHGIEEGLVSIDGASKVFDDSFGSLSGLIGLMSVIYVVPSRGGYLYGISLLYIPIQMVPRILWTSKSINPFGRMIGTYGSVSCAAPCFAEFYANFGIPGVIIGMVFFGFFSRSIYELWKQMPERAIPRLLLASFIPLMIHVYTRAPISLPLIRVYYVLGPILFVALVSRSRGQNHMYFQR